MRRHIVHPTPETPEWHHAAQMAALITVIFMLAVVATIGAISMAAPVSAVLSMGVALASLSFVPNTISAFAEARA